MEMKEHMGCGIELKFRIDTSEMDALEKLISNHCSLVRDLSENLEKIRMFHLHPSVEITSDQTEPQ